VSGRILKNSEIAELLASQAESVRQPVQKAMRRAARRAFLWPEEAARLVKQNRLTELPGVGPYLSKVIRKWFEQPPRSEPAPRIRADFLTITEAPSSSLEKSTMVRPNQGGPPNAQCLE
jgi:hypothetical protein